MTTSVWVSHAVTETWFITKCQKLHQYNQKCSSFSHKYIYAFISFFLTFNVSKYMAFYSEQSTSFPIKTSKKSQTYLVMFLNALDIFSNVSYVDI